MTDKYQQARGQVGDTNACVPIAMALVVGADPAAVNAQLIEAGIRRPGKGVRQSDYHAFMRDQWGVKITAIPMDTRGLTAKTVARHLDPNHKFLISMPGHVAALVNGQLHDWTEGRKHKVLSVHLIGAESCAWMQPRNNTPRQDRLMKLLCSEFNVPFHRSGKNKVRVKFVPWMGKASSIYFELLPNGSIRVDASLELAGQFMSVDQWEVRRGRAWIDDAQIDDIRLLLGGA